jgi:hypothetical protein
MFVKCEKGRLSCSPFRVVSRYMCYYFEWKQLNIRLFALSKQVKAGDVLRIYLILTLQAYQQD